MKKYRKKPIIIEAIQWTGKNYEDVREFVGLDCYRTENGFFIITLEGDHLALANDYIIKGIQGEFYPCKPDIFKAIYEEVTE